VRRTCWLRYHDSYNDYHRLKAEVNVKKFMCKIFVIKIPTQNRSNEQWIRLNMTEGTLDTKRCHPQSGMFNSE